MAIYMQIQGIEGDVTSKGHQKWIKLDSVDFNVKRVLSQEPGRMIDREGTRPAVSEVVIQKTMDKTTPLIFTEACVGKAKGQIKIHMCTTNDSLTPYMEYTLYNPILSGYQVHADGKESTQNKERPKEVVHISYDKIEMKFTPFDDKHAAQAPIPSGYDLKEAVAV